MLGEKTFNAIGAAVASMLTDYADDLNVAYGKAEKDLSLSVAIKIDPVAEGNRAKIVLSFVKEKVKEEAIRIVQEEQGELFSEDNEI